jgi:hypothetical protein
MDEKKSLKFCLFIIRYRGIDYISFLFRLEFLFIFRIREVYLDQNFYFLTYMSTDPICFGFTDSVWMDEKKV